MDLWEEAGQAIATDGQPASAAKQMGLNPLQPKQSSAAGTDLWGQADAAISQQQQQQEIPNNAYQNNSILSNVSRALAPQSDSWSKGPVMSPFMAAVENFNRVFGQQVEGLLDLGAKVGYALGGSAGVNKQELLDTQQKLGQMSYDLDASNTNAFNKHPVAGTLGTIAGIAGSAMLPFGAASSGASLGQRVLTTSGASALMGFTSYAPDFEGRMENAANSAIVGGALPLVAKAVSPITKGVGTLVNKLAGTNADEVAPSSFVGKLVNPTRAATQDTLAELKNAGQLDDTLATKAKFDDLGINAPLTDVANNPGLNAKVRANAMNTATRGEIQNVIVPQGQQIDQNFNKIMNDFVPGGYEKEKAVKNMLYKQLDQMDASPEVTNQLLSDPILARRMEAMNSNPDFKLADIPDSNLGKLNSLKKFISNEIWSDTNKLANDPSKLNPDIRANLLDSRKNLSSILNSAYPEFKAANEAGERIMYYDLFSKALDKPATKAGSSNVLADDQIYSKLFGTQEKRDFFLNAVQSTGGNPENAQKLMDVMNMVKASIYPKMLGTPDKMSTVYGGQNTAGLIQRSIEWLTSSKYQKALLKLSLSPTWDTQLTEALAQKSLPGKLSALRQLAGYVSKQGLKAAESEPMKEIASRVGSRLGGYLGTYRNTNTDAPLPGYLNQ